MREKILVALKTKYKTLGFSEKAFDGVADYLSKTVTEESQIETAISGVEGLLKSFQGDVDFVRNEKSGLQKQLDELKKKMEGTEKKDEKGEGEKDEKKDEIPSWAQTLIDSNKSLSEKLAGYEQKTAAEKRDADILSKAKEYGIPDKFITRFKIADDVNLDDYMKEVKQEFANIGFEGVKGPESGDASSKNEGENIASMIGQGTKEIVESKK
jgi:hypothetical protein